MLRSRRQRRRVGALVASLYLGSLLASAAHFLGTAHTLCPEHGTAVSLDHQHGPATGLTGSETPAAWREGHQPESHAGRHDHCSHLAQLRATTVLATTAAAVQSATAPARLPPRVLPLVGLELLRLAPKHSPPPTASA